MTRLPAQPSQPPLTAPRFGPEQIKHYLVFGFVPQLDVDDPLSLLSAWSRLPVRREQDVTKAGLVREGQLALRAAMQESASKWTGNGDQDTAAA